MSIKSNSVTTPLGVIPKGCVLSYQTSEFKHPKDTCKPQTILPSLPLGILENIPCVYDIADSEQTQVLDKLNWVRLMP